jgi:phosphoglycerate kinase
VSSDILGRTEGSIFDATQTVIFKDPMASSMSKSCPGTITNTASPANISASLANTARSTVEDLKDLEGKKVYVRVDFNVPQKGGVIRDDNRIKAALPTIKYLVKKGARVVLMSHLGKIDWKKGTPEQIEQEKKDNDMAPVAKRLGELLAPTMVSFCPVTRGEQLKYFVNALKDGEVLLVQNTRYEKGEEKNDPKLAKEWASLVDVFVMDAFGSAHRAHASTVGVPSIS